MGKVLGRWFNETGFFYFTSELQAQHCCLGFSKVWLHSAPDPSFAFDSFPNSRVEIPPSRGFRSRVWMWDKFLHFSELAHLLLIVQWLVGWARATGQNPSLVVSQNYPWTGWHLGKLTGFYQAHVTENICVNLPHFCSLYSHWVGRTSGSLVLHIVRFLLTIEITTQNKINKSVLFVT